MSCDGINLHFAFVNKLTKVISTILDAVPQKD